MKKILFTLVACLMGMMATAQTDPTKVTKKKERKVELSGEVYDSFTKAKVKAHLTLLSAADSAVVDTTTCWTYGSWSGYDFKVPARQADFIIKATADGYEDTYMNYQLRHIARNNSFELPRLLMKKKQRSDDDIYKEVGMEGVVITGTKVKLAYRGDTLVYNASAFNLPEGSMLDGLIRQMPGAELKDNGDIYINGRKVDYLTLNGKDFFKGQNKVMLDNLPYYTVKELKVYDKSTKRSELIGQDMEKKDYVMDVQLKREYNRGYMANAEAGGGTDDRYMARLFGLYYDDHSRASLFGNLNNVNETRQPGGQGDWTPSNMPQGQRTTRQTGLHFETEDQDKRWEENFDATFNWSDADNETRNATETFATGGNIFGASEAWSRQKDFRFSASNTFILRKPFTLWGQFSLSYANGHRNSSRQDSTWQTTITNRNDNSSYDKYRTLALNGNIGYYKKFDWGDIISIDFSISYNREKPSDHFSLSHTGYSKYGYDELRHYYTDQHGENYQYHLEGSYHLQFLGRWFVSPFVGYWQTMRKADNMNYRLDWLYNTPALPASPAPAGTYTPGSISTDWLPSTREALQSAIDPNNCDTQTHMRHGYSGGLELSHNTDNMYFSLRLPINNNDDRMHYDDGVMDTIARRNFTHFTPRIQFYRWNIKRGLQQATYSVDMTEPSFADLMPVDDTTNPLAWHINNPDLKTSITHNIGLSFVMNNDSTRHLGRLWTNARLTQRAWGTRTMYDQNSGAYTYMQDNIDGNWYWGMGLSYEMPLDKKKRLTLQQRADAEYQHSVDFDVLYVATTSQPTLDSSHPTSTVNNWTLHEHLGMEYQRDKLTATLSGDVSWRSANGDRQNFERISAFDFNYGATLRYTIPWVKLSLATDLRMFSRRGYNSAMMNTDDLVWNAELARTLCKEKLTLKLTAFDLLHQLSNKQYSVNAQGRTETWNNCIPRYFMLSVAYKFTRAPKK